MGPRENRLPWDDHHMLLALLAAQRSPDPNTQVGACLVNPYQQVLGVGYNAFPRGCDQAALPWVREGDFLHTKYPYVIHAEKNAIFNAGNIKGLESSTLYVTLYPCNECMKDIIQAGITRIIYLSDKYADTDSHKASRILASEAEVIYTQHVWTDQAAFALSNITDIISVEP